jgi:7-keto-8-aminopelargonate synthetase-like enzyme
VPEGTARLRISVNLGLTDAVMDEFVDALTAALQTADAWPAVSS